jgi:multiple sugar transport system permease protein
VALNTAAPPDGTRLAGSAPPPTALGAGRARRLEAFAGYVFLSPWLLGLLGITALPTLYSLYLSFTDYDLLQPPKWVGLDNYVRMFTADPQYRHAVTVTVIYALVAVPLKLATALAVALLLERARRGIGLFRSLFYIPSLLGGSVAIAILWQTLFGASGAVNAVLAWFGITGRSWVNDPSTALGTLVVLGMWQFGAPMVVFLAGLKQIPRELYEAAAIDGAGWLRQFRHVTVPLLSPVIFFNLVLETIHGFQGFTGAFIISNGRGGPADSTLLYTLYLYKQGFTFFHMGYASAMAWVFLVVIGLLTAVLFWSGRLWVHYSDAGGQR